MHSYNTPKTWISHQIQFRGKQSWLSKTQLKGKKTLGSQLANVEVLSPWCPTAGETNPPEMLGQTPRKLIVLKPGEPIPGFFSFPLFQGWEWPLEINRDIHHIPVFGHVLFLVTFCMPMQYNIVLSESRCIKKVRQVESMKSRGVHSSYLRKKQDLI